jgi:hypothetical protein
MGSVSVSKCKRVKESYSDDKGKGKCKGKVDPVLHYWSSTSWRYMTSALGVSGQLHVSATSSLGRQLPVPIGAAGWVPELVWMLYRQISYPAVNQTLAIQSTAHHHSEWAMATKRAPVDQWSGPKWVGSSLPYTQQQNLSQLSKCCVHQINLRQQTMSNIIFA